MDISIIIDKSTFQSLNFNEIQRLTCYYKHIITPVLVMEILGDLKKETEEGKKPPEERVKDFARKLFPMETIVNSHYKFLIKEELLDNPVSMDGRPNVRMQKAIRLESGIKGYLVKETQEEKAIYKWRDGNFSEADRELSALWRITTTRENILKNLQHALKNNIKARFSNLNELNVFVDSTLVEPSNQHLLLLSLFENYDIDAWTSLQILQRWNQLGNPLLKKFAPYAFHCMKVDALFHYSLASELISTRPTNRVDLEYLYYLPFGNIFTSDDKVHKDLAPLLISNYQKFIPGSDLKKDLKIIVNNFENSGINEKRKLKNGPPIIEGSITYELWKEFYGYPERSGWRENISEKEKEMIREKFNEFFEAIKNGKDIDLKNDEADFILRASYLSKDDFCFCGSNKKIIDCCIPEEKLDEIIKNQENLGIK